MSVKIKINWSNENIVSESIRIYRADSVFTSVSLPSTLAEIVGDVNEYEDGSIVEGQTYFYMLSAKLGEQEAFTECFEVVAFKDVSHTLAIIPIFFTNSVNLNFNADTGDFKAWKSGISSTITSTINSLKLYAEPYRNSESGSFYYELICTKVINNSSAELSNYRSDEMVGVMQEGATVNINSISSNFPNAGFGRYILRNDASSIVGAGANLTTASTWSDKISNKQLALNEIWGVGIRASGNNTLVELWIDGVYQGVMFTVIGTSINFRPLIIFTLENNLIKATHYRYPRILSFLPDGFQSWLPIS